MKILHISKYYYPFIGGVEQVARDVVNSLKCRDIDQKIICFNHEKGHRVDFIDDVEVIRVSCFKKKIASQSISVSYGKKLKKIICSFNPDVIIFHYPNPFVAHYLLKYRKKGFKTILYWHLDITKQKILRKLFNGQNNRLLKMASKIVATSPNYIDGSPYLSKFRNKCEVVPCCVNKERLSYTEENIRMAKEIKSKFSNKKICFAFGRHVEYKGLIYLVKASKLLDENYVVLIGGTGPLTESLIDEARDDNKLFFLGRLSDNELKSNLLACDIFCFPSITKNEAFGIGLAEAMYYEKPTVTFNIPGSGVNYVSINGETGIEVENKNVEEYARAITTLANDVRKSMIMGEKGRKRVIRLFSQEQYNANILNIIDSLTRDN